MGKGSAPRRPRPVNLFGPMFCKLSMSGWKETRIHKRNEIVYMNTIIQVNVYSTQTCILVYKYKTEAERTAT